MKKKNQLKVESSIKIETNRISLYMMGTDLPQSLLYRLKSSSLKIHLVKIERTLCLNLLHKAEYQCVQNTNTISKIFHNLHEKEENIPNLAKSFSS